jgi:hypothetical protein
MPQIFDPTTFSAEQAKLLVNIPGKSLAETNTPEAIRAAQALNPSPNIPVYQIEPTTPFKPVNLTDTTNYNALLAGTKISLPEPKTPEQLAYEKTQQDILAKMKDLTGQEAFAQQKAQELGIPEKQKELNDLQAQLRALNAEAAAQQEALANQPILSSIALGQQAQVERTRAIKALSLSAQIQALQGNIALAQDQVQQAVDLKYKPIIQELNLLNQQLEFNKDFFNAAEKKRAEELKRQNDLQLKQLGIQIANEKDKNATLLNLMQTYPDAGINLNDTIETATQKIQVNSRIYANKIKGEVGGGYTDVGLIASIIENPELFNDLTPKTKERLIPQLTKLGVIIPPKLTVEQQTQKKNAESAISAIDVLQNALDADKNIFKKVTLSKLTTAGIAGGFGYRDIKRSLQEVQDVITRLRTGAALNESEISFYKGYVPSLFDTPQEAQFKLNTLKQFYQLFTANPGQTFPDIKKKLAKQLQPGEILVQDKQTGRFGAIPSEEYDPKKYFKVTP